MAWSVSVRSRLARWQQLAAGERRAWLEACRRLAVARVQLGTRPMRSILEELSSPPANAAMSATDAALASWAIPSAANRVPWRSDCLIQAMAAAAWLRSRHMGWQLHIGVRREPDGSLGAHAWLTAADQVVTGGLPDLDTFKPIPLEDFSKLTATLRTAR